MNIIKPTIKPDEKFCLKHLKQKNNILRKFSFVLIIAIAYGAGFAYFANRTNAEDSIFEVPICQFEEQEGRTTVNFEDKKIVSHLSEEDAESGPVAVSLLAGSYKVSLFSFDGYEGREGAFPQPTESWSAILKNGDSIVAESSPIDDLDDSVQNASKTQVVDENLVIDEDVDSVTALNAGYPNESSPNSVYPVCAAFDLIKLKEEPVNNAPTINLLGDNPMVLNVGDSFTDPGATASDTEDGDLTGNIIVGGDDVDTGTAGTYTITYNVSDSEGKASDEVTRTVIVTHDEGGGGSSSSSSESSSSSSSSSDGGGTGGVGGDSEGSVSVGGGSGQISFGGTRRIFSSSSSIASIDTLAVAEESSSSSVGKCSFLNNYLKFGKDNDTFEVLKLQGFLITMEHYNIPLTGIFDQATLDAVSDFQERYKEDILEPWGYEAPTGYVYITTKNKINEIFCGKSLPLSEEQKIEIEKVRAYIEEFGSADGGGGSGSEGIGGDIGSADGEIGGGADEIDKSDYLAAGVGFIKSPMAFILDNKLTLILIGIATTLLVYMFSFKGGNV